ncbi:hypothetical protein CKAH01_13357 [Colletotrichum kahawae]|uniref:Nephrocystin 3-like N-terminal domain-containing protein n=1 Tax=Colletotrichum kahawae TaxID=34407 RepID=A0AAD9YNB2_COLKA|nr:hypothetical protein CKAH01_13357 [Colletotrichum kahawae]
MRGVVAYLMEQSESSEDIVIRKPLYFFFDDKDSARKTSAGFVRSVPSQILVDERTSYLVKYLEIRDSTKDTEVEDNLWICLSTVIQRSREIVFQFVIDAIDEVLRGSAGETTTILDRLENLITQDLSGRVKLILSQREMPQNNFLETHSTIIDVDNDYNWQNVQAFVRRQIRKRVQRSQISASTGDIAENRIMEISQGNFLHARLALHQFSEGITNWSQPQIYKSLNQLTAISHGLVAAYCKLLSSIPRAHRNKARASFAILRVSKEKLTSRQLAFFATLYTQKLDKQPSLWSELQSQSDEFDNYLAETCGYLIRRAGDGLVDFNHTSVKDLFTDSTEGLSPEEQKVISTFEISEADAHAMMHTLCLSIFQLEGTDEVADLDATQIQSFARTPCFTYALRHSISHYEAATPRRKDSFSALLRNEEVLINYSPDGAPLHHAARCVDDAFYIQKLIDHPYINVNVLHASGTPLHVALDEKNRSGVDALLAHPDIDLGMRDSNLETPYLKTFEHAMWEPLSLRIMTMVPRGNFSIPIPGTSQLLDAGRHGWTDVEEIFVKMFPYQVLTQDPETKMHVLAHYAFFGHQEKLLRVMDHLPAQRVSLRSEVDHYDLLHLCANQNWEDIVHMMQRKYCLQSLSLDHMGRTLLHWALEYNWDIYKMDLSQYSMADLNKKDRDGLTAVHIAVTNRNMAALEILVASGASCLQKDNAGMSPAHIAADQGYRAALEYFIDIRDADFGITRTGVSLLHLIALWVDGAMIRRFVTSRKPAININSVDREHRTALHYAAKANNVSAVEALVTLGCNINGRDNNGKSPIHEAIRSGGPDAALRLLHLGADWRATDDFGQTCLHLSLRYNSESLVPRFLPLGMDIGAVDWFGMTPLHRACGAGNVDHVRELLHQGAAWDARNLCGRSPLELAVEARAKSTVEIVLSWVLTLPEAQINGSRDRVKRYFDSALKLACELELDSTRIGKMLKEAGADIDYSKVKVKRVYLLGPTAEKRNPIVPLGNGLHNPFDKFNSGPSG